MAKYKVIITDVHELIIDSPIDTKNPPGYQDVVYDANVSAPVDFAGINLTYDIVSDDYSIDELGDIQFTKRTLTSIVEVTE